MPNGRFQQNLQKKGLKKRSKHHHRILQIPNSPGIKFQLKQTILNFWTILTQKGHF